jgi:hypothetical protein
MKQMVRAEMEVAIRAAFTAAVKRAGGTLKFTHEEMKFKGAIYVVSDERGVSFEIVDTSRRN